MLSLHTNAASLFTKSNLNANQSGLSTSMTRLGTGLRINSAMDDAAGLQIATRLDAQSRGMGAAMKNAQNGISLLQTGEGALNEVSNILLRMKDLATEGANATTTTADKAAMQAEYDALGAEIGNIMKNTRFGGTEVLDKTAGTLGKAAIKFQIGASAAEVMDADLKTTLGDVDTDVGAATTMYGAAPAAGTEIGAAATITKLDKAIASVSKSRGEMGAAATRLQSVYSNLGNVNNNTQIAKGRIMDTDYASESASMTSKQMLMQAGTSMLKQSSSMSQLAMSLLQ
ncbi:flagellin [Craterilacuibacter sp. RT1T]|uniref:flagellin N-terminal helical domain-containing protein n=1 Tax=Craterilacuibacter sp. RT1T TaxID=2942211 RepID=UPI0020767A09|nr:flagellin [Craterilacuibacter sp. RT1T]MCL6262250.1 Lateral flagellin [Craterilacuibacter sp. RT1T]